MTTETAATRRLINGPHLDGRVVNLDAMPRGLGCRYLVCMEGPGDILIAKRWARKYPKLGPIEVSIDLRPDRG